MEYGTTQMVDGQRERPGHRPDLRRPRRRDRHRAQAGNVVFAGTLTLTGGTVVIDHGCGVKSYLYGLETVDVERGSRFPPATRWALPGRPTI